MNPGWWVSSAGRPSSALPQPRSQVFLAVILLPVALLQVVLLQIVVCVAPAAMAAELDEVRRRGELVWAADQEGGGPHVFPDPDARGMLRGFEVEFAELIAAELGVKARFQQGQWDRLPLLLGRSADCVINGIELTPERRRDYRCSRPYFGYALQLVARRDGPLDSFARLAGLGPSGRWRVGVLTGSAAEFTMRSRGDLEIEVVGYDGTIDSLEQVASGVLDAAVMDDCIFSFYADGTSQARRNDRRQFGFGLICLLRRGAV